MTNVIQTVCNVYNHTTKKIGGVQMAEVEFYPYSSCPSCRKTKKWLIDNQVIFEERHLFRQTPTVEELIF